jgi:antitoxin HicB
MEYSCRLTKEGGLLGVEFPDLPNVITVGRTRGEAIAKAGEALNAALASDVARGFALPRPSHKKGRGLVPIEVEAHIVVANELRLLRGERSQSEIAALLGLSYQAYQRLENPTKSNPTIKTLERVAKALGKRLEIGIA